MGAISECKNVQHFEWYDYEIFPDETFEVPFSEACFTRRMKLLINTEGFMLYGKSGTDFSSTSKMLYPNVKLRLPIITARPSFYINSDTPNECLGIVDCFILHSSYCSQG